MSERAEASPLWWVVPGELAGMAMPRVDPERRRRGGGDLREFADELPMLWDADVRSVICLLNMPADKRVYESAGLAFLCAPIPVGEAPSLFQLQIIAAFVAGAPRAVLVHCQGGLARTGTILAALLILRGTSYAEALNRVRQVEPDAIETPAQLCFLQQLAAGEPPPRL